LTHRNTWRRRVDELVQTGLSQDEAVLQAASEQPLGEDKPVHGRTWTPPAPKGRMVGFERGQQ